MDWREWLGLDMTPERFARRICKAMQAHRPGLELAIDHENFRLMRSEHSYFNLHNVFQEFNNAARKERSVVIARFARDMLDARDVPVDFAAVKPLLVPVLRRRSLLDQLRREGPPELQEGVALACRDFGPDAILALAVDAERSMSIIMNARLEEWGVSFETAMAAAMENLRDRTVDNFCGFDGVPGLTRSNWFDGYDSSRILLCDLLHRGVSSGKPVVMVPTREMLLLAPENNVAAQFAMLALAEQEMQDSPRWCSTAMYQVVDGRLDVYVPRDDQVRERLRTLERNVARSDYADQKQQLEKLFERDDQDVFVATFGVTEINGRIVSMCAWCEESTLGMLPKTDVISLGRQRPDGAFDSVVVNWATLMERHPDLLRQLPGFPTRYQVETFPASLFDELLAAQSDQTAATS